MSKTSSLGKRIIVGITLVVGMWSAMFGVARMSHVASTHPIPMACFDGESGGPCPGNVYKL